MARESECEGLKKYKIRQSAAKPSASADGRFRDYNGRVPLGSWYSPFFAETLSVKEPSGAGAIPASATKKQNNLSWLFCFFEVEEKGACVPFVRNCKTETSAESGVESGEEVLRVFGAQQCEQNP